jgi:CubicO group peptidase (beta-lactamase class C family)
MAALTPNNLAFQPGFEHEDASVSAAVCLYGYYGNRDFTGSRFEYSDTGYVICGILVEQVTGRPLHEVYRDYVFDPLGMDSTSLEGHEPARRPDDTRETYRSRVRLDALRAVAGSLVGAPAQTPGSRRAKPAVSPPNQACCTHRRCTHSCRSGACPRGRIALSQFWESGTLAPTTRRQCRSSSIAIAGRSACRSRTRSPRLRETGSGRQGGFSLLCGR